ncbi:ABC-three component system protein [Aeromicrobium alkaliterrae]
MGYPFEDLDDSQFERLAVQICRKLFGIGVAGFAAGPDGGRDAKFVGTAEVFPSRSAPWTGTTIIQAKHTIAFNAHCSDPNFSGSAASSVMSEEIPRIKKLTAAGAADNYIVFTNRRLGAELNEKLSERVKTGAGVPEGVFFAGIEYLDDMLRTYPDVLTLARIDPVDGPLRVSSADLAEVILGLQVALDAPLPEFDVPPVDRVSFDRKNELNNMSSSFAAVLQRRFQLYTKPIEDFLANPANHDSLERYEAAVEDFELKIVAKRSEFQSFDDVFNHLLEVLFKQDAVLARQKSLVRAMVFYMYWHCDIGEVEDAAT